MLAVVGPTASGKSRLGMEIATRLGGEIIGADSRQIYRHMDIGTAKPTLDDREQVPHHLVDIIDPSDEYSVALYVRQAREAISDVLERGAVPHRGWRHRPVRMGLAGRLERAGGIARPFAQGGTPRTPRPKRTVRPRSRASQDRSRRRRPHRSGQPPQGHQGPRTRAPGPGRRTAARPHACRRRFRRP